MPRKVPSNSFSLTGVFTKIQPCFSFVVYWSLYRDLFEYQERWRWHHTYHPLCMSASASSNCRWEGIAEFRCCWENSLSGTWMLLRSDKPVASRWRSPFRWATRRVLDKQLLCTKEEHDFQFSLDVVNDKTLFPTNVVCTTHDWHDTIDAVRSIERSGGIVGVDIKTFRRATPSSVGRSGKIGDRSFLTYQLTMALHVETSWCPYQLFHRTFLSI